MTLIKKMWRPAAFAFTLLTTGLPALAAELVMIEEPGCVWCERWNRELSTIYPKTAEGIFAPLSRMLKDEVADSTISLARPVNFTPTFILVENGLELGRIEGYPGEDFFWGLLGVLLTEKAGFQEALN